MIVKHILIEMKQATEPTHERNHHTCMHTAHGYREHKQHPISSFIRTNKMEAISGLDTAAYALAVDHVSPTGKRRPNPPPSDV